MSRLGSRWGGLVTVVFVAAVVVTLLEIARPELWCVDGYYHIRAAEMLRSQGIARTFPWWQETFLRDRWADKDFLYHLFLIPFTLGDLVTGARAAAVVCATAMVATFHEVLRRLSVPRPAAWTLALLAFAPMLLARLAFPRGFVLAIALSLAGTAAIFLGRHRAAGAIAAAYAWTHISYHVLPCLALVHELQPREDGRRSFRTTLWTLGGMILGVVVNPYFPNNLRLWWVQNIHVLSTGWAHREDLRLGQELLPPDPRTLLTLNAGIFLCFAGALWLLARAPRRSTDASTALFVAAGFTALTFRSTVFLEFAFPFTMLFAALVVRDAGLRVGSLTRIVLAVAALVLCWRTTATMVELAPRKRLPDLWGAAAYLRDHVPDGETVFHSDWDEFPPLYFTAPELHYLVGLDPTFMLVTDRARWRLYHDLAYGRVADAYAPIRSHFRSRFVLATADDEDFLRVMRRDPRFHEAYRDATASVFELEEDGRPAQVWTVRGTRIPTAGFVDLAPVSGTDRCATAETDVAGTGPFTLGIASDDEVRLLVNDREVYARSPRNDPRAGVPGGRPISLDDLDAALPDTAERSIHVALAGSAHVTVEACRLGDDFGFFLRLNAE